METIKPIVKGKLVRSKDWPLLTILSTKTKETIKTTIELLIALKLTIYVIIHFENNLLPLQITHSKHYLEFH
jgi:hypothetical protein